MAKAELAPPSNRLFIPGSEAVEVGGVRRIGPNSVRRVERAAHHYMKYRDQFKRRGAFILCSGGYSGSAHGQEAPVDRSQREARLLSNCEMSTTFPHT
ncbi:MAG TPA: hypothetical protein VFH39_03155 [Candidatus Saccharimonadales bacterium]|nr:hypothetical protein [Candidatus Saccharimonadales bacterium]